MRDHGLDGAGGLVGHDVRRVVGEPEQRGALGAQGGDPVISVAGVVLVAAQAAA